MSAAAGAALLDDAEHMSAYLPGFAPRAVQSEMAEAVATAVDNGERLVVEAGTGTGKTLAYLLPALASGQKVIISTATRYLQEQLADKDVPLATRILGHDVHIAVLKGRSNYLCLHRLEQAEKDPDLYDQGRLRAVRKWAARTQTGDLGEFGDLADGSRIWPKITSTADNCIGRNCPFYEQCWVMLARREAQQADLVIINHHLLFADLTLRERGFGELLPQADTVVIDEAHKLPDIAGRFFGQAISGRQILDFDRDLRVELKNLGSDMPGLRDMLDTLKQAEQGFANVLARDPKRSNRAWADLADDVSMQAHTALGEQLETVRDQLEPVAERSDAMESLWRRAGELVQSLGQVSTIDADNVSWIEPRGAVGWVWHSTPLDIAEPFSRAIEKHAGAWLFTSATLAVDNSLAYFCSRMGLGEVESRILASPFDYAHNALLYVPARMPRPGAPAYTQAVAEQAIALIRAADGGAFVLCTSYRSLHACAGALAEAGFAPLVQGQDSRSALLNAFREQDDRVLVGTNSFWEGVDVRGHGLRLVIIDKLPFAAPGDPVQSARTRAIKEAGGDPFMELAVPQAVISLKQGVGRLIRDTNDRGLLAICDPRLYGAGYARRIRNSLPPMPATRVFEEASEFLDDLIPITDV